MNEYTCNAGHSLLVPPSADPNTINCFECALANGLVSPTPRTIAALRPSETIAGRAPLRPACGGGLIYRHEECGGEALVWDIIRDGFLILECDCGERPTRLAYDLGIDQARLLEIELDISARMLAERTLQTNPDDLNAKAVLHALGPT